MATHERTLVTAGDVESARPAVQRVARRTPVLSTRTISDRAGGVVVLKAENLQRTGSFKVRGAVNKIAGLSTSERAAGVVAASAGNHGQAVAWAAREAGIAATIFMPEDAPMAKVEAAKSYGAEVVLTGMSYEEAHEACRKRVEAGATLVHPFEDEVVIAGQGTLGLELAEAAELEDLEVVTVPIGGGGLASGIAVALKELRPGVRVVGVQAANMAPLAGEPVGAYTIADGIAVKRPGERTSAILRERLDDVVTVTDDEIAHAIVLLLERVKLVVEGAGAASVAALLGGKVDGAGPACAVLSGGNIDPSLLIEVARYSLTQAGRFLVFRTHVQDRPGALANLLTLIAGERVNLIGVQHQREGLDVPLTEVVVELTLQTRDEDHCAHVLARLREWGYEVERLR
jgi:threonine dehydratase